MTNDTVDWVYAILAGSTAGPAADEPGVAGEAPRLVRREGLAALVGSVPAREYSEESLRERFEDLRWLESSARAHHRVVKSAAHAGTVLPLRFATIYRDDERVREMLSVREEEFTEALSRLAGRVEWGVKVYADPEALSTAPDDRSEEPDSPGTAYLLRKRAQQRRREDASDRAAACAERIHGALAALAASAVLHPPQDAGLAHYQGWMVLNASYLTDDARTAEFTAAVAGFEGHFPGIRLEFSGPWPAYSFVADRSQDPTP